MPRQISLYPLEYNDIFACPTQQVLRRLLALPSRSPKSKWMTHHRATTHHVVIVAVAVAIIVTIGCHHCTAITFDSHLIKGCCRLCCLLCLGESRFCCSVTFALLASSHRRRHVSFHISLQIPMAFVDVVFIWLSLWLREAFRLVSRVAPGAIIWIVIANRSKSSFCLSYLASSERFSGASMSK